MITTRRQFRIVNFHGIGAPARQLDPGEAEYWISEDRFRNVLDRIAGHGDRDCLLITFDDGNLSDLSIAAPELLQRGLVAEFFVLTGRLGTPGSLAAGDVRLLTHMGMRIGSHGISHRDWTSLPAGELDDELRESKEVLEAISRGPIRSAAIPFGRYNASVLATLRRAGYESAYSTDGGSMGTTGFLRPRTSIRHDTDDAALERILSGRMPAWNRLRRAAAMTIKAWA
ncbi:MAG TPA: polysaccharide deacetylase family protein [Rhizobiaceae bacterium]